MMKKNKIKWWIFDRLLLILELTFGISITLRLSYKIWQHRKDLFWRSLKFWIFLDNIFPDQITAKTNAKRWQRVFNFKISVFGHIVSTQWKLNQIKWTTLIMHYNKSENFWSMHFLIEFFESCFLNRDLNCKESVPYRNCFIIKI